MRIRDIQEDALRLCAKHNWPDRNPSQRFRYLISEVGELADELLKLEWEGEDPARVKQNIGHEMYDIVWNLCDLANQLDIDLEAAFEVKKQQNQQRTWTGDD
jgi:NTP pyrophosphatase (non-canonical NTP hydrolase)